MKKFINFNIIINVMTRILGDYANGEVASRVNPIMQALKSESDITLEAKAREGLRFAESRDSNGVNPGVWELITAPVELYEGIAAMRVLEERRGNDYVLGLLGHRMPETMWERTKYFFTNELPLKE